MKEPMPEPSSQFKPIQFQKNLEVSIVAPMEAEATVPSPIRLNAFGKEFEPRRFAAYRINEISTGKVFYIPMPFRAEANLAILHFRVPYGDACQYLSENVEEVARTNNPPLLKITQNEDTWAAGALWFMQYTKSDLGCQGNSQSGDYPELCMTFTATEDTTREVIPYMNKYTIASLSRIFTFLQSVPDCYWITMLPSWLAALSPVLIRILVKSILERWEIMHYSLLPNRAMASSFLPYRFPG
jgi:hypothetical protein